jgi:precorrin-3B methylase
MNLKLLNYRNCNLQRDRFSDNLTTNPQLLMIADESLITELTATIYNAMNEQRTQTYLNLINQLLSCNDGDEPQILQKNQELLDRGLVEVMVAVAQQYREAGRENEA